MQIEGLPFGVILLLSSQIHETENVGIHPAAPDLVTARLREIRLAKTRQKRSYHHHRPTKFGTPCHEIHAHYVVGIEAIRLESIFSLLVAGHLHTHTLK